VLEDEAVLVVVAPGAQVHGAVVVGVDGADADLLLVEAGGPGDVVGGEPHVGQVGQQLDHR
jgi:hypothetical protein